jgi:1,2-diacylglycerol 3-alpha-glucosyltransferase
MRIGMMADIYKPHTSGVTSYISLNKQYLEKQGHEVFVFTFGDPEYQDDEKNVIRSPGLPVKKSGVFINVSYSRKAKALLQTMDIVHVHHPFLSGQLALRYCKPLCIPIVFTNHTRYDLYIHSYFPRLPEGLGETFLQAYLPSFCRSINLVISPSKGMEAVLYNLGVDVPIKVIPNGVDLHTFRKANRPVDRAILRFSDENVVLIYMGRIAPEKNLPFLLQSFSGVAQTYEFVRLLVIGDGPEREAIQNLAKELKIADKITFTGMVPYQELVNYLAIGDAFVTASLTEVHPLSVIEAMSAGLPILGIASPGIEDTVVDGETGLLSKNDLAGFTARMVKLVTNDELRRGMGHNARLRAENYAIEKTAPLIMEEYERLTSRALPRLHGIKFQPRSFMER